MEMAKVETKQKTNSSFSLWCLPIFTALSREGFCLLEMINICLSLNQMAVPVLRAFANA